MIHLLENTSLLEMRVGEGVPLVHNGSGSYTRRLKLVHYLIVPALASPLRDEGIQRPLILIAAGMSLKPFIARPFRAADCTAECVPIGSIEKSNVHPSVISGAWVASLNCACVAISNCAAIALVHRVVHEEATCVSDHVFRLSEFD